MLRDYLRLFRAQTAPATILLVLVPYLANASFWSLNTLVIGVFALFVHWISFGHNSLMDTAMGYDLSDPGKKHHPLVAGRISMSAAHNIIHWGLCGLAIAGAILSLTLSPNSEAALVSLLFGFVFGYAYNSGLSKECLYGFVPIAACFTSMGAWAWFLSHPNIDPVGIFLLGYFFLTITFQTSWSGHLKEMQIAERSNLLIKMGARIVNNKFIPRRSRIYGWTVKILTLVFACCLLWLSYNGFGTLFTARFVWLSTLTVQIIVVLHYLTKPRLYVREKELLTMSIMEILTIYLPVFLVLSYIEATVLMFLGVFYFFAMNKLLWGADYPRV